MRGAAARSRGGGLGGEGGGGGMSPSYGGGGGLGGIGGVFSALHDTCTPAPPLSALRTSPLVWPGAEVTLPAKVK